MAETQHITDTKIPAKQGKAEYEVGYCKPPQEHQFKPGQSGNPKGPPVKRTQLWVYFCQYMSMTDAEIDRLDRRKLTQAQQTALKLVENAKDGKAGSQRLALAIFDREEGKIRQAQVIKDDSVKVPITRQELLDRLTELDELEARATKIQMEVNERVG